MATLGRAGRPSSAFPGLLSQRTPSAHPALQNCFAVVQGGPEETGQLLKHKFDYIFFTGEESAAVAGV